MSKIIRITPEYISDLRKEFEEAIKKVKVTDGKLSFSKTFSTVSRKAVVYFSEVAWLKMQSLIREFDKEVAWHGVAHRSDDPNKDEYYITDVLVYPQEVTGATVNTDQKEYETWLMSHDDDVFDNIRMHGHSHVNMGVTPSGVDLTHQEKILEELNDTMFYIFMIWNKKGDKTVKIYDLAKNVLFDGTDVTVEVMDGDFGLEKFIKDAKNMVKDKVYTPTYNSNTVGVKSATTSINNTNKRKGKRKKTSDGHSDSTVNGYGTGFYDGYPYGWYD